MSNRTLIAVGVSAAAIAVVLVVVSIVGGRDGSAPASTPDGTAAIAGLPQDGAFLGSPDARHVLVEYADLQCPFCGQYATGILPEIVDRYVRTGKLRLEFRGLAFVGPDSASALKIVEAAAEQNLQWNVLEALFAEQGKENAGWVQGAIDRLGDTVPGFDLAAARSAADSDKVASAMAETDRLAREDGISGTPTFTMRPTGGTSTKLEVRALDVESFVAAIESALAE